MQLVNDFKTSVEKALDEIDSNWRDYEGLIVCGTHTPSNEVEDLIKQIKECRKNSKPFLGICAGMQLAVIEYARNVLGIAEATSQEYQPDSPHAVIVKLPELRVGIKEVDGRYESHWHNYAVEKSLLNDLRKGFNLVMSHDLILEEMTNKGFWATQYHPEYQSSKKKPHPILKQFLEYAKSYK